jgi:uncharacterized RDD family membrane protein YckC
VVDTGVSSPPPPPQDDLETTVAMPRVKAAPPPPGPRKIPDAVVDRPPPRPEPQPRPQPQPQPRVNPVPPTPQWSAPVGGTVILPPRVATVTTRPIVGNPFGYVCARFFAFAFDVALVAGVATSLMYSLIAINPITGLPTNTQRGFDATLAIGLGVALAYVWVAEAFLGTTIWKLVFGLHVYPVHGRIVGFGRAFLRGALRPIDVLIVGGVMALLPARRRLGDLLGGTVVAPSPLRAFAPLIGWILVLVLCGIPFILAGTERTLASIIAFGEFGPGLFARIWLDVQLLLNFIGHPH